MNLEGWIAVVGIIIGIVAGLIGYFRPNSIQDEYRVRIKEVLDESRFRIKEVQDESERNRQSLDVERDARNRLERRLELVVTENVRLNGVITFLYNEAQKAGLQIPNLPKFLQESRTLGDIAVNVNQRDGGADIINSDVRTGESIIGGSVK